MRHCNCLCVLDINYGWLKTILKEKYTKVIKLYHYLNFLRN